MAGKNKGWYQSAAKWISKTKNWYLVVVNWIGNVIQGLIQKQIYIHVNLFKLSLGCFLKFQQAMQKAAKWQFKKIYMYVYLILYQSLYDITNPIGHN